MKALQEVVYLRLSTEIRERVKAEAQRLGVRQCDVLRVAVARGLAISEAVKPADSQQGAGQIEQ